MRLESRTGNPTIGGSGENLSLYIKGINDPSIEERIGKEKLADLTSIETKEGKFSLVETKGAVFRTRDSSVVSSRFLLSQNGIEFFAAVQATKIGKEWILSNIYVRPDFRRRGFASALVEHVKKRCKGIKVDDSMTDAGAAFFGHSERKLPTP